MPTRIVLKDRTAPSAIEKARASRSFRDDRRTEFGAVANEWFPAGPTTVNDLQKHQQKQKQRESQQEDQEEEEQSSSPHIIQRSRIGSTDDVIAPNDEEEADDHLGDSGRPSMHHMRNSQLVRSNNDLRASNLKIEKKFTGFIGGFRSSLKTEQNKKKGGLSGSSSSLTSSQKDRLHISQADIRASPRLQGYFFNCVASIVMLASSVSFYVERDCTGCLDLVRTRRNLQEQIQIQSDNYKYHDHYDDNTNIVDALGGVEEFLSSPHQRHNHHRQQQQQHRQQHQQHQQHQLLSRYLQNNSTTTIREENTNANNTDAGTATFNSTTNTTFVSAYNNNTNANNITNSTDNSNNSTNTTDTSSSVLPSFQPSSTPSPSSTISSFPSSLPSLSISTTPSSAVTVNGTTNNNTIDLNNQTVTTNITNTTNTTITTNVTNITTVSPTLSPTPGFNSTDGEGPTKTLIYNTVVWEWKLYGAVGVSAGGVFISLFIILAHFDSVCFPKFWNKVFHDGSIYERYIIIGLVCYWICALYILTSSLSVGFVQANVFFTSWIAFASTTINLGVWRNCANLPSMTEQIRSHHRQTTFNWMWVLIFSLITSLSIMEMYANRDELFFNFNGELVKASHNEWIKAICASWAAVGVTILNLVCNHYLKDVFVLNIGCCSIKLGWRHMEGILLLALIGLYFWVIVDYTGVNGVLSDPSNVYFGIWGIFFSSIFTFGTWLKETHGLLKFFCCDDDEDDDDDSEEEEDNDDDVNTNGGGENDSNKDKKNNANTKNDDNNEQGNQEEDDDVQASANAK